MESTRCIRVQVIRRKEPNDVFLVYGTAPVVCPFIPSTPHLKFLSKHHLLRAPPCIIFVQVTTSSRPPSRAIQQTCTLWIHCTIHAANPYKALFGNRFSAFTICDGDNASKHECDIGDTQRCTEGAGHDTLRNGDDHCGTSISDDRTRGCAGGRLESAQPGPVDVQWRRRFERQEHPERTGERQGQEQGQCLVRSPEALLVQRRRHQHRDPRRPEVGGIVCAEGRERRSARLFLGGAAHPTGVSRRTSGSRVLRRRSRNELRKGNCTCVSIVYVEKIVGTNVMWLHPERRSTTR